MSQQSSDRIADESLIRSIIKLAGWAVPRMILTVAVCLWLSTAIVIVPLDEVALYQRLGEFHGEPLQPGPHLILPFPMGQTVCVAAKQISTIPIGFDFDLARLRETPLLWTHTHGKEFPMVLGSESEVVVVNGLLRFKVSEKSDSLRAYVRSSRAPEKIIRSLAHQAVRDELAEKSMQQVLKADRCSMQSRLLTVTREASSRHDLGLEIVDFELLSIHPPVNVASAYLNVVKASIIAESLVTEETIDGQRELLRCQKVSADAVADAKSTAISRLTKATTQASGFSTWSTLFKASPDVTRTMLLHKSLTDAIDDQSLVLMDADLPKTTKIWIEESVDE